MGSNVPVMNESTKNRSDPRTHVDNLSNCHFYRYLKN